jgi:hypothetical protein
MALVMLILVLPAFYAVERDVIAANIAEIELAEIADYTSNTLANLYFLANSTNNMSINLTKEMLYLPLTVRDSPYTLSIVSVGGNASKVTASLKGSATSADAWLVPGLKVGASSSLEITRRAVIAGCYRNANDFYVWLGYGD